MSPSLPSCAAQCPLPHHHQVLEGREADVAEARRSLQSLEAALTAKHDALKAESEAQYSRTRALDKRDNVVKAREVAIQEAQQALQDATADLEARTAALAALEERANALQTKGAEVEELRQELLHDKQLTQRELQVRSDGRLCAVLGFGCC